MIPSKFQKPHVIALQYTENIARMQIIAEFKNIGLGITVDPLPLEVIHDKEIYSIKSKENFFSLAPHQSKELIFDFPYSGEERFLPISLVIGFDDLVGNFYTQRFQVEIRVNKGNSTEGTVTSSYIATQLQIGNHTKPEKSDANQRWAHTYSYTKDPQAPD